MFLLFAYYVMFLTVVMASFEIPLFFFVDISEMRY